MIKDFAHVRLPVPSDMPLLVEGAKVDEHAVLPPWLVVEKDGKPVGYFHVSPCVMAWLSTKELVPRDTFHLINTVENILRLQNVNAPVVPFWPVPKRSPLHAHAKAMGYLDQGEYTIFTRL